MASQLNVIALISGGKDSLFSILHCLANGHQVVALANLHPPQPPTRVRASRADSDDSPACSGGDNAAEGDSEDLNSFMYQTVGHALIPLYEGALGIPLYRREISGTAVNSDRSYYATNTGGNSAPSMDETESLVPLLQTVMRAHPEANAVSSGAILSDYQRTRVESVAVRLGLIPLAYLWQYPRLPPHTQSSLLEDMQAVGMDARTIKVASGGLDSSFLWENVASIKGWRRLDKAMSRFGSGTDGALLGEGGEFETLAIDGPDEIWQQRISVEESDRVVVEDAGSSALLSIKRATLAPKIGPNVGAFAIRGALHPGSLPNLRIPDALDPEFANIWKTSPDFVSDGSYAAPRTDPSAICSSLLTSQAQTQIPRLIFHKAETTWFLSNLSAPEVDGGASEQMAAIARLIQIKLSTASRSSDDIVFTAIYLRSMASFAGVNEAYALLFSRPNPPARLTVALGDSMLLGVDIMLSLIVDMGPIDRRNGLHVQSRSYWAPANIGPYSQAVSVQQVSKSHNLQLDSSTSYIAGQIPLMPASMDLPPPSMADQSPNQSGFLLRALLSLQHLWRIGTVKEVDWWTGAIAFVTGNDLARKARIAGHVWNKRHSLAFEDAQQDQESDMDPWDRQYGTNHDSGFPQGRATRIPNLEVIRGRQEPIAPPPFFAVQVHELPRACDIEWVATLGITTARLIVDDFEDDEVSIQTCFVQASHEVIVYARIPDVYSNERIREKLQQLQEVEIVVGLQPKRKSRMRFWHTSIYTCRNAGIPESLTDNVVPCLSVWSAAGARLAAGIVIRGEIENK
ncbi:MAG: hypothetical protein M4579_006481 [Chaenotheca gracillima]|nr:MAG: hypothetical protein M4579_006481 [Chaenotheca gracillima]